MEIIDWDLLEYDKATQRQLELVERVAGGETESIVICRHPAVVTVGRGTNRAEIAGWTGAVCETSRGGRSTYHGPSQLILYPILDLRQDHATFRARDLHGYMRALEQVVCQSLHEIGIQDAEARGSSEDDLSLTGVWVGKRKIASIGIAVRKWITYHGCAINVEHDPKAFQGIRPCGFQSSVMTSVEELLGIPKRDELARALVHIMRSSFAVVSVDSNPSPGNVK